MYSTIAFTLESGKQHGYRRGILQLKRPDGTVLEVKTPGFVTATSRGVVSHLTQRLCEQTEAVRWIHATFESLYVATRPFPASWRSYSQACDPDIVFALTDTPFTPPPFSQKRSVKSVERSLAWLSDLLRSDTSEYTHPTNVFVQMAGGVEHDARAAFADGLTSRLYDKEADMVRPLQTLDEGVAGYSFDLAPLRATLSGDRLTGRLYDKIPAHLVPEVLHPWDLTQYTGDLADLVRTSLSALPEQKPRLVNSCTGPHEILQLIQSAGVDLFDAAWAQRAADIGIALDFQFPVPQQYRDHVAASGDDDAAGENDGARQAGIPIGYNLYNFQYAHDFRPLTDHPFPSAARSPVAPSTVILHSSIDSGEVGESPSPFSRAYIHHLLHTHEMSAHALLLTHNLSVLDAFFNGVRELLGSPGVCDQVIGDEIAIFSRVYDASSSLFNVSAKCWAEVELARGKGRLAREKAKELLS
ncbi:tRNA-guanine transglycosylase [Gloeophyllum trabeum ATCC 11539]|uniref:tRNA-guanine transglycosylase n=1 Tax=Gloeophyllum trabeum (strain ATCC 11539 / FP-39264 / Madison 617) TaxID=670483 RepID=S7PR55_GLOTA|nr:tRNA-guanine transglycosylase [Gloeophyllum trabeum ATCC 11539]EPQ50316.1 tRNA-guanine transglycosylase [Gloeophyllum trabeum ATCC 11539]